jgi:hypothetical protein
VALGSQCVGQGGQRFGLHVCRGASRSRWRSGGYGIPTQQGAQGWQAHGVEGTQGHFVARQLRQASGIWPMASRPRRSMASATGSCPGWLAWNTPLMARRWLAGPSSAQFHGGAGGLLHGAGVGAGDEHHGGQRRVAQRRQGGVEAGLLHLQPRVRPQAGGAPVVARQKPVQALGKLSRRSVWPVGAVLGFIALKNSRKRFTFSRTVLKEKANSSAYLKSRGPLRAIAMKYLAITNIKISSLNMA